jgi:hypothetical protein
MILKPRSIRARWVTDEILRCKRTGLSMAVIAVHIGRVGQMSVNGDEAVQIRKSVEAIDDEEPVLVLKRNNAGLNRFWAADLTVNAPSNQVRRHAEILGVMKEHTGLQYSSFQRHREATVVRRDCVVKMGYEIVVPEGDVPDSGKTINRRYTNIYYFEDAGWHLIARQATNVSVR